MYGNMSFSLLLVKLDKDNLESAYDHDDCSILFAGLLGGNTSVVLCNLSIQISFKEFLLYLCGLVVIHF